MDFNHPATFSITFNTTSASGALACIAITTIDDRVLEGDHDFSHITDLQQSGGQCTIVNHISDCCHRG